MLETLSRMDVQRVHLTGTFIHRLESFFMQKVKLDRASCIIIRAPALRPELAHHVIEITSEFPASTTTTTTTLQLVRILLPQLEDHERMIVFTKAVSVAENLASCLGSAQYYSAGNNGADGMESQEKAQNFNRWVKGQPKLMVSTSALNQGIDLASIRFIVFHEGAYGMIHYYQGAGRGGRSCPRCDVYTVWDSRNANFPLRQDDDVTGTAEYQQFLLSPPICRIISITTCMDGDGLSCADIEGQHKCDVCEPEMQSEILALKNPPREAGPSRGTKRPVVTEEDSSSALLQRYQKKARLHPESTAAAYGSAHSTQHVGGKGKGKAKDVSSSPFSRTPTSGPSTAQKPTLAPSSPSPISLPPAGQNPRPSDTPLVCNSSMSTSFPSTAQMPTHSFASLPFQKRTSPSTFYCTTASSSSLGGSAPTTHTASRQSSVGKLILDSAATNRLPMKTKKMKIEELDRILPALKHNCPVCFILSGDLTESLPVQEQTGHVGQDCPHLLEKFNDPLLLLTEWQRFRKCIILPGAYAYCFGCGLPQERGFNGLQPKCHGNGFGNHCQWKDKIMLCLFALYYDAGTMEELGVTLEDVGVWGRWLSSEENETQYWRGLEIFIKKAKQVQGETCGMVQFN